MIRHILLIGSLLVNGIAFADDSGWIKYSDDDSVTHYISSKKFLPVKGSKIEKDVWIKSVFHKRSAKNEEEDYTISKHRIRCSDMNIKTLRVEQYGVDGRYKMGHVYKNDPYEENVPSSNGEFLAKLACN